MTLQNQRQFTVPAGIDATVYLAEKARPDGVVQYLLTCYHGTRSNKPDLFRFYQSAKDRALALKRYLNRLRKVTRVAGKRPAAAPKPMPAKRLEVCDIRCETASGKRCDCACSGKNHGAAIGLRGGIRLGN